MDQSGRVGGQDERGSRRRPRWVAVALCGWLVGCGADSREADTLAVLGAFPAELAALVERAEISEATEIDGQVFRVGRLGGAKVVLGLPGFPAQFFAYYRLASSNAAAATNAFLEGWNRHDREP